jgi:formylglycine-generating enzyme required for sulfatase activity
MLLSLRFLAAAALVLVSATPGSATVVVDWVVVGNPGNPADTNSSNCFAADCGSVPYAYQISRYEVTNAQYAEFLNAKAAADPLLLYNSNMNSNLQGGISRSGLSGSYTYTVKPGFADKPVNYVSFYDATRFTNWLNNGQGSGDTETGAYTLLGGTATPSNGTTVTRNDGANIFLPSENEWYKAAYFDGTSFLNYPAGSNEETTCAAPGAAPNTANCGPAFQVLSDKGAYTGSASPYGTFDQGGNVFEWNEGIVEAEETGELTRGIRGGFYLSPASYLAASARDAAFPYDTRVFFGFRVAGQVPEPGTALLVMTGLAGLAARQRRRRR